MLGEEDWSLCMALLLFFLKVIALAIILLFVVLAALRVLIVATRTIVASIVSMTIVRLEIITIVLAALMIVTIFVAVMLLVAQFMATCSGKMSRFLFFWLLFILGGLLENASRVVSRLTLLEESNELEWISGHHLVQVRKLELMPLGLRKEDLFTLLLHRGYFHRSTKVATLEIAEKLYSMPHELMHRHESKLFGSTKPADLLVAYIGEPGDGLKVVPDTFVEVCLRTICVVGASLCNGAGPYGQAYIPKTLTHQVEQ